MTQLWILFVISSFVVLISAMPQQNGESNSTTVFIKVGFNLHSMFYFIDFICLSKPMCGIRNTKGIDISIFSSSIGSIGSTDAQVRIMNFESFSGMLKFGSLYILQFGEWPHVCYLQQELPNFVPVMIAGASLIAPGIVLTAAHWVL